MPKLAAAAGYQLPSSWIRRGAAAAWAAWEGGEVDCSAVAVADGRDGALGGVGRWKSSTGDVRGVRVEAIVVD